MKKLFFVSLCTLALSANASETAPDPSNLTQVNSFAFATIDNDGTVKGMLGLAGQYSEGNNFIGLVEHGVASKTNDYGKKDQNTRLRYFQVLDTASEAVPQAGFSIDYMRGWESANGMSSDLVALGAIAKVTTPWDALSLFPNVAYVVGKAGEADTFDTDVQGYQLNLFGSISIGDWGQYVVIQPQYMRVKGEVQPNAPVSAGDLDADVFKVKTGYGQPISKDGLWWMEISHTYTRTCSDLGTPMGKFSDLDNDNKFEAGIAYYF